MWSIFQEENDDVEKYKLNYDNISQNLEDSNPLEHDMTNDAGEYINI
ncbi:MAG: hypothetical protein MTP17_01630 [Candidatus Midichloria sp.]|nr:MAG: hypothetical protein MTP17_01630 [Candidatus Midichloria sp.]